MEWCTCQTEAGIQIRVSTFEEIVPRGYETNNNYNYNKNNIQQ